MQAARELAVDVGAAPACQALGVSRATFYRRRAAPGRGCRSSRSSSIAARLHQRGARSRAGHAARRAVHRSSAGDRVRPILDKNRYLCSIRTMYRLLADAQEVRQRRDQLRHPTYRKPELLATAPNQLWSWDIIKLLGPAK